VRLGQRTLEIVRQRMVDFVHERRQLRNPTQLDDESIDAKRCGGLECRPQ
jgi:hypothetical protein